MKLIATILGICFLISSFVMIKLVRSGGALKPAGVIKPAEIGTEPDHIAKQIAIRLYPEFDSEQIILWRVEPGNPELARIPAAVIANFHAPMTVTLQDLRATEAAPCEGKCWYVLELGQELPVAVAAKTGTLPTAEVFIQNFEREVTVSEACNNAKILDTECMKPVSVREVHRKLKTPGKYFFMQRYLKSKFYLFIEK